MPPDYYIVPDLINLSFNKGKIKISESGLLLGKISYEYVDTLLNNTIKQTSDISLENLDQKNRVTNMVNSGSKGKDINISQIIAALGPCIAQKSYEVGAEYKDRFVRIDQEPL